MFGVVFLKTYWLRISDMESVRDSTAWSLSWGLLSGKEISGY